MIKASTPWSTMPWMSEISLLRSDSALVTIRSIPRASASSRIDWVSAMRNGFASRSDWANPIVALARSTLFDAVASVDVIGAEVARRGGNLLVGASLGRTGGPGIGARSAVPCQGTGCRRQECCCAPQAVAAQTRLTASAVRVVRRLFMNSPSQS